MAARDRWLLVDTETSGLAQPIYAVEIAAQLMEAWEPLGEPFRRIINHGVDISKEASRVNGFTREILERDGSPPGEVYADLFDYANGASICSYNLRYDYDDVLAPEWKRLGVGTPLERGFCLLRLTQRLIDPVPAGNHKLQTLRQFYRLPERGAHTALGDVQTVLDLLGSVLRPVASTKGLKSFEAIKRYANEAWYPTKIPFGKFQGRSYKDAKNDPELLHWLEWLSQSENERSKTMGAWYLSALSEDDAIATKAHPVVITAVDSTKPSQTRGAARMGIVVFNDVRINQLKSLVSAARERLADLEMILDRERAGVAKSQAALFSLLKDTYRKRDSLRVLVEYRKKFIRSVMSETEQEPDEVRQEYQEQNKKLNDDFDQANDLVDKVSTLDENQQNELKDLYRKLVKLYHPDRVLGDDDKSAAFTRLMAIINHAKANLDIDCLREIANDPAAYMRKHNLGVLEMVVEDEVEKLMVLYDSLQSRILETIATLDTLKSSAQYEFYVLSTRRPSYIHDVAKLHFESLQSECQQLEAQAAALKKEIDDLELAGVF